MAKTAQTVSDDGGESVWGSFVDSLGKTLNSATNAYATAAGLKNNGNSSNPDDYRSSQTSAQQPNGTPITSGSVFNSQYLMWGAIALFAVVVLILLVKVL